MSSNFWESKKVLVTGATGFIGSWLTEALLEKKANVTVLVNKNDQFGEDAIQHLKKYITIVYGNLKDKSLIKNLPKDKDIIFHLGAVTQVLYSLKNPIETFEINVIGTQNLLESIRKSEKETFFIYASTDKVYGEPKYLPIDEHHPLSAKSPYDASKVAADRLVYSYHCSYGLRVSILRWSNTYGGRDSNTLRVIPDFVMSILKKKPPIIRGNGKHIRDFIYVTDIVKALLLTAEQSSRSNGEIFNFGTGKPITIEKLANLIIKISGNEGMIKPIILGHPTPGEIYRQYLSSKKAKKILGWKPTIDLISGLKLTIEWYKKNPWWYNVMERVNKYYRIRC